MILKFDKAKVEGEAPAADSLGAKLAAARERRIAAQTAPTQPAKPARSILFGTGLTQKEGAKAGAAFDRTQAAGSRIQRGTDADIDERISFPKQLIDPNIKLDPSQETAVNGLLRQQFGCIIGKAGTGKSTSIRFLLARLQGEIPDFSVAFCAYTGRAVQQIKRQLPQEYHANCDTIHGLLEYAPEEVEVEDENGAPKISRRFVPHRTAFNPLTVKVIIVDETGMCPIDLWNNLLAATPADTRIYLLGDIYQLPPVHGRSVLGFAMLAWPTFELERIHRTKENAITDFAWDVMAGKNVHQMIGEWTKRAEENKSVILHKIPDGSVGAYQHILGVIQHLTEKGTFNARRDAIITPQNGDQLGQETLNERLCAYFNEPIYAGPENMLLNPRTIIEAGYNHLSFAVGDKVMVTKNDREQGLTNGMIGIIESIIPNPNFKGLVIGDMAGAHLDADADIDADAFHSLMMEDVNKAAEAEEADDIRTRQASHIITVNFQNVEQPIEFSTAGAVNTLQHAYAFTCHKAQGGEFPVVVVIVHASNYNMLSREWLYTAVTRTQQRLIVLYNTRGLEKALNYQVIRGKTLADKAKEFLKVQQRNARGDESALVPNLPAPCEV